VLDTLVCPFQVVGRGHLADAGVGFRVVLLDSAFEEKSLELSLVELEVSLA